jgi:AcrR family transcriptional regulator
MARRTPTDRLEKLINAAAEAFVANGYERTQMDDVATRLGVSKGTIYRSVDSKESLLAAVLMFGDAPEQLPEAGSLDAIDLAALSDIVRDQLAVAIGRLAIARPEAGPLDDFGDEVQRLALDQYAILAEHRVRIMVLDRCAPEIPEVAGEWYDSGRYVVEELWVAALERSSTPTSVDVHVLARTIVELITLWAVKMPWDPAPRPYVADAGPACARLVRNLVMGNS